MPKPISGAHHRRPGSNLHLWKLSVILDCMPIMSGTISYRIG